MEVNPRTEINVVKKAGTISFIPCFGVLGKLLSQLNYIFAAESLRFLQEQFFLVLSDYMSRKWHEEGQHGGNREHRVRLEESETENCIYDRALQSFKNSSSDEPDHFPLKH